MKFSVWPSPDRPWSDVRALAEYADRSDFHCFWYADHFMPNTEDGSIKDGDIYEAWSVLAAVASSTNRIRLGSLVSPTTVRHPAVLSNVAASIDRISEGRLTLGIGAGWQINEHRAYGIELFDGPERVDRFEEAIEIIRMLLTQDRTTFVGRHFSITDAPCQPRPVQTPLPLMVGTGGPRMTRITARFADEWNVWGTPSTAADKVRALDEGCARVGRDPRSIRRSVQAMFFVVDDRSTVEKLRKVAPADRSVIGDSEHIAQTIGEYESMGFDEVIVPDFTLGATHTERIDKYERLRAEVFSRFR
jgi:alkanesulfonate monooxygenase SsuD/methylene tetrahydromethanopterin reductase-like flavin-dependent oxidoreductase (luciferase family)